MSMHLQQQVKELQERVKALEERLEGKLVDLEGAELPKRRGRPREKVGNEMPPLKVEFAHS